jgi:hypothetical protein
MLQTKIFQRDSVDFFSAGSINQSHVEFPSCFQELPAEPHSELSLQPLVPKRSRPKRV